MSNKSKTIIVTILLFVFMLGALSISEPMPVTGGEEPPTPCGSNGEIPFDNGTLLNIQISDEVIDADMEEDLTFNKSPDNQIMANSQIASYAAFGFSRYFTEFDVERYACLVNGDNEDRIAIMNVNLPHGSRITEIELNGIDYHDTAGMSLDLIQIYYEGAPGEKIATLTSGFAFNEGTFYKYKYLDHEVDNFLYNYVLRAVFPAYNSSKPVAFCNAVIYYTPPSPFVNALPMISTNN